MKKIVLCLSLVCIFTFCKKSKSIEPSVEQPSVTAAQPDNIEQKTIEPSINLTSSNGNTAIYVNPAGKMYNIILPYDTTASDSVTIEKFSHFQFKLIASNHDDKTGTYTSSSAQLKFQNGIQIRCSSIEDSIVAPNKGWGRPAAGLFSEGNLIGPGMSCLKIAYIHFGGGNYDILQTSFPIGDHYLGFKTRREGKNYYGWIKVESFGANGIKVKEIAINKTANKSIICGQKN